jgi:hypothetical protein
MSQRTRQGRAQGRRGWLGTHLDIQYCTNNWLRVPSALTLTFNTVPTTGCVYRVQRAPGRGLRSHAVHRERTPCSVV